MGIKLGERVFASRGSQRDPQVGFGRIAWVSYPKGTYFVKFDSVKGDALPAFAVRAVTEEEEKELVERFVNAVHTSRNPRS